jgi:hypothetical protein
MLRVLVLTELPQPHLAPYWRQVAVIVVLLAAQAALAIGVVAAASVYLASA